MSNFFVIYTQRVFENIHSIASKTHKNNIIFRPHFKTHQNHQIGEWFRQEGIDKITVSSLKMAKFFMAAGWDDITIAFPVDKNEIPELDEIASQIYLQVLITNKQQISYLSNMKNRVGVMIEIDVGYHRSGIWFEETALVKEIIEELFHQPNLYFMGLLSHFGNSYNARNKDQIIGTGNKSIHRLMMLKNKLTKDMGIFIYVSIGDTPTASILETFGGVDELRPGNFVFYDLMQLQIGSCQLNQIAAVVRCAIVDKNPTENQLLIHGGAVHFSKEVINYGVEKSYGRLVDTSNEKWKLSDSYLISLSQEHGVIQCTEKDFNNYNSGDYVDIIPVHSCLAANLMKNDFLFV